MLCVVADRRLEIDFRPDGAGGIARCGLPQRHQTMRRRIDGFCGMSKRMMLEHAVSWNPDGT